MLIHFLGKRGSETVVCGGLSLGARHHMALHSLCLLKDTFSVHRLLSFPGTLRPLSPPPPVRPLWCEDFHIHLDLKANIPFLLAPITTCMGSRRCLTPPSPSGGQGFRTAVEVQHFCTLIEAEIGLYRNRRLK